MSVILYAETKFRNGVFNIYETEKYKRKEQGGAGSCGGTGYRRGTGIRGNAGV